LDGIAKAPKKVKVFAELVKFEHTIFALPFAYAGAILGARGIPSASEILLITLAMVGARSAAMGFNRLIDWEIDRLNPRTKDRPLPRGLIGGVEVLVFSLLSLGLLIGAAWLLDPLAVKFLPLVVPLLVLYPYTKRFTWLCHFWLGAAQFFAPFGAWLAVSGEIELPAVLLGATVGLWVAGFDIIYATLDLDFDRQHGLYSLPAAFGLEKALLISRCVHLLVVGLLLGVYLTADLGLIFLFGVVLAAILLFYEHSLVSPQDLSKVDAAFFNVNGYISVILFAAVLLDHLLGV